MFGSPTIFGIIWIDVARFQRIDEMIIGNHHHLNGDDECYFLIEFTSHEGYEYSSANSLILNLKKAELEINESMATQDRGDERLLECFATGHKPRLAQNSDARTSASFEE